ncbi:MAG TPA: hypothetical protein EYH31_11345 [Anaerolineae bacterium]|nr:hypothetical protein [Anaerolineae bacterium]
MKRNLSARRRTIENRANPSASRWRGPDWRWLLAFGLVLGLGLGAMLAAGTYGVYQGLRDRDERRIQLVREHYQRGLTYLEEGRKELARAEFAMALRLDPSHRDALKHLQALVATPTATVTPLPTDTPTPTPTVDVVALAVQSLWNEAQVAYSDGDWETTIERLEQLRVTDPNYQADAITSMLFDSCVRLGRALVAAGEMEQALRRFDQALALHPDDTAVRQERRLAAQYIDALTYWAADWQKAITGFEEIYATQPDYLDVAQRLPEAYRQWGDVLARKGDWCTAAERYQSGLQYSEDAELRRLQADAAERCRQERFTPSPLSATATSTSTISVTVVPSATLTPSVTLTPSPVPTTGKLLASGRIAFATFDGAANRWHIYSVQVAVGAQPELLIDDGDQPAFSPDGQRIAFRSRRGDRIGLIVANVDGSESVRVTTFAEDAFPSWSPEGDRLAFASNRHGDRRWRIYRAWIAEGAEGDFVRFGQTPAWSPDGSQIVHQGCDEFGQRCGLWGVGPDQSNPLPLTDVASDRTPAWNPNGTGFAFTSLERSGNWDIYFFQLASGTVTPLVLHPAHETAPAWSPDGRYLAFLSARDGIWALYLLDPNEPDLPIRLLNLPGDLPNPSEAQISWRP